jgi:uncharacterized protein YecE (DUF72 family)
MSLASGFSMAGTIRIGISGWRYEPWRGEFYPTGLPQRSELDYASRKFSSIEINGSFYSLQRPESYASWYAATPPGFVFAVKGGRFITHMRKLREVEEPLANFFASGVLELREKLGPFLWQLPPNFPYNPERVETFLGLLPKDSSAARTLARRHSAKLAGRTSLKIDAVRPLRHAIEIRHESYLSPDFIKRLRAHSVALVIADTAGRFPLCDDLTSDFVYIRLHGDTELYRSGYSDGALARWAKRMRNWSRTRDIYCYFDNTDVKLRAPVDARNLMARLGVEPPNSDSPVPASVAERPSRSARARRALAPLYRDQPRRRQAEDAESS